MKKRVPDCPEQRVPKGSKFSDSGLRTRLDIMAPPETSKGRMVPMQSNYETLRLERISEHVLLVTMDRPEVANAHNTQMGLELRDLWGGTTTLWAAGEQGLWRYP